MYYSVLGGGNSIMWVDKKYAGHPLGVGHLQQWVSICKEVGSEHGSPTVNDIKASSLYKDMVMRRLSIFKSQYVTLYCADFSSFPTVPMYIHVCTFMYENVYTCASIHVYSAFYNYTTCRWS